MDLKALRPDTRNGRFGGEGHVVTMTLNYLSSKSKKDLDVRAAVMISDNGPSNVTVLLNENQ